MSVQAPNDFSLNSLRASEEEKKLLTYCDTLYKRCKDRRVQFERQWYMNMAFYFGRQYATWVQPSGTTFNRLWEPPAPPWRVRLVVNKVRSIIRTELAKVTREKPRGYVIPSTSDDDDIAAAKAGDAIFDHLWRELLMQKQLRRVEFWTLILGTSFLKDWYDSSLPDWSGKKGSICVEPVSPFHLYVPIIQEEELENQPFVIHQLAKDPDYIERVYGKKLNPDAGSDGGLMEQTFMSALGINTSPSKEFVAVREAWIKPCAKYPKGKMVTWGGGRILSESDWPYEHSQYPFTKFDHIPTGKFYADSAIVDLIPLQKEYNRTRSQIIESKNRMSKPQLVAAKGSVDANKITSEPGLVIFYTPGFTPPTPLPLQSLPSYVLQELDRTQSDMDDISSQHEITKGRTPPGVTAATAISYLQEEDDSKLALTISSLEEGVEKLGRHFLSHVQQYWSAERKVKVIGTDNQYETYLFTKADLKGNVDFRVEVGSAIPRSRAAKQAFIMELGDKGWISPDKALRFLDMAETGKLYEELQLDARQAQRENLKLLSGEQLLVNSWDNDLAHIIEHDNKRKQQTFETSDEQIKQMFEMHVQMHKQKLAASYGLVLEMGDPQLDGFVNQIMMTGQPPQMGVGEPPQEQPQQGVPQ